MKVHNFRKLQKILESSEISKSDDEDWWFVEPRIAVKNKQGPDLFIEEKRETNLLLLEKYFVKTASVFHFSWFHVIFANIYVPRENLGNFHSNSKCI